MVKHTVQWSPPSRPDDHFTFEYEIKKHSEASTVRRVHGKVYRETSSSSSRGGDDVESDGKKEGIKKMKKQKGEEEVGYLDGYEISRGGSKGHNKLFHDDAGECCATTPARRPMRVGRGRFERTIRARFF